MTSICFHAPQRPLRPRPLFESKVPDYSHYTVDPINRAMDEVNQCLADVDLFSVSLDSFQKQLFS